MAKREETVAEREWHDFKAELLGRQRESLDLMLVGEQPLGAWVLAFCGAARRVLTADEAQQTNAALDALEPLLRAQGRFGEAVAVLQAQAGVERDVSRAIACAEVVVRWLTHELGRPDLARDWVERIRGLDTTHWLVHFLDSAAAREREGEVVDPKRR